MHNYVLGEVIPEDEGSWGKAVLVNIRYTKIYDKRDDFDFEIVNFPFLDGDVPRSTSYGVYISQLIRFARASSYVADFNTRNNRRMAENGFAPPP